VLVGQLRLDGFDLGPVGQVRSDAPGRALLAQLGWLASRTSVGGGRAGVGVAFQGLDRAQEAAEADLVALFVFRVDQPLVDRYVCGFLLRLAGLG
jgi:hypothetical protein